MRVQDARASASLAALWGGSFAFIRVAVRRSGPIWLAESRVALAFAALFAFALIRRNVPSLAAHWRAYLAIGTVNSALPFALFSFAEQTISASNAAILNATSPFFGAIVAAAWLREPLGARRLTGMALGLAGVVLLVGWQAEPLSASDARRGAGLSCRGALLRHRQRLRQGAHDRHSQLRDRGVQPARRRHRPGARLAVRPAAGAR